MREMALPMTKATLDVAAGSAVPFTDQTAARAKSPTLFPLEVQGLCFDAGGRRLIDNLDLTLSASGTTMIMGPNGAGKSVFFRLIHGLLQPSSGSIKWSGKLPTEAVRRKQALVFQKPVLLRRSVAENVDFVLRAIGNKTVEKREQLLEDVDLEEAAFVDSRSNGEVGGGKIPGAVHLEWTLNYTDDEVAVLKSPSALAKLYADQGITPDKRVHRY